MRFPRPSLARMFGKDARDRYGDIGSNLEHLRAAVAHQHRSPHRRWEIRLWEIELRQLAIGWFGHSGLLGRERRSVRHAPVDRVLHRGRSRSELRPTRRHWNADPDRVLGEMIEAQPARRRPRAPGGGRPPQQPPSGGSDSPKGSRLRCAAGAPRLTSCSRRSPVCGSPTRSRSEPDDARLQPLPGAALRARRVPLIGCGRRIPQQDGDGVVRSWTGLFRCRPGPNPRPCGPREENSGHSVSTISA